MENISTSIFGQRHLKDTLKVRFSRKNPTYGLSLGQTILRRISMPKHLVSLFSALGRSMLILAIFCLPDQALFGQTAITTFTTNTASATSSTTLVTSPSDATNSVLTNTQYNINYGGGNDVFITSYTIGATVYDNFLNPDTLVVRRTDGSRFINIWYSLTNIDTGPNPDEINLVPTIVSDADAIYQAGILNGGYDNILVNDDDLAGASIQAQTERIDIIWYSGIVTSSPTTAVFPVIERGGNDNVKIAGITSLDGNGDPSGYTSLVTISSSDWTGGGVSVGTQMILRRQTVGQDPIPILNNGSQNVEGVAVSFDDLGIAADEIVYGFSIFASDVVEPTHDLLDITTFPNTTLSSVSGLDLVAGLAAAVASDDELIEAVGPGGYKAALTTWLKANESSDVTTSTEASLVTEWLDHAIGNHDATTLTTAPVYRSTSSNINFNPTVDFTTSETGLQIANNTDFNTATSYSTKGFNVAFRTDTDITTRQQIYEQGGNDRGLNIFIDGGNLTIGGWNVTSDGTGSPWSYSSIASSSIVANTEYIVTVEFTGNTAETGSITVYLNGQSIGTTSSTIGLLFSDTNGIGIGDTNSQSRYGASDTTPAASFDGEISEFIYCNSPGSFATAQRNRIESYLAIKYGITLNQSTAYNYVNSNGDVIFNTTSAASIGGYLEYNNDIAGIGRDDDSELIQLQSKSENTGSVVTVERATSISNDDNWLIWGNDAASTAETALLTMPDTIDMRLTRVWRVAEEGEVGVTSVSFDLTELGLSTSSADIYSLLIAGNSTNADFSSATVLTGGTINSGVITFTGVDLEDGQYFTLGTDFMICSPGGVEVDLALWYKADAGTNTVVDAADVTSWADQSINANDASESNGGGTPEEPTYRTGVANYNPVIRFTDPGTTSVSYLESTSNPATQDMTLISVFSTTQSEGGTDFWNSPAIIGGDHGNPGNNYALGLSGGQVHGKIIAGDAISLGVQSPLAYTDGQFRIASATRIVSGALELYINSENVDSGTSDANTLNAHSSVGIGNQSVVGTPAQFAGDIPEVIIFADNLDSDELNRVESYLSIRYGITRAGVDDGATGAVDERDYRRSDGTVIWDYTGQTSTYYNDIAGIGRDDLSCYEQRQSSSINSDGIVSMGLGTIAADNPSNPNSFATDGSFLVWGNDNDFTAQANANTVDLPGNVTERMERIWQVQETGTVGATTISFDITGLGYGTTLSDFQLITSNSATMASGTLTQAASLVDNILTFTNVDLTDGQFFTIGTARTSCGPGGVTSNLALWLRADAGSSTTVNGADVETWNDQAGSNNATGIIGDRPAYLTTSINFNPAMDFDESNFEEFRGTGGFHSNAYYIVANNDNSYTSSSTEDILIGFDVPPASGATDNFGALGLGAVTGALTGEVITHAVGGTGTIWRRGISQTQIGTLSADETFLIGVRENAGATGTDMFVGGLEQADLSSGSLLTVSNVAYEIGSHVSTNAFRTTNHYDGQIPEVISFSSRPSDAEHNRIQSYLAVKYGITLDNSGGGTEGDYVRADGTTIWDASDFSTYHNDVAGIGRDDDGCFSQKQSSSVNSDDILTMGLTSVETNNASNTNTFDDDGDYLIWGNDDGATAQASANTADVPSSVSERMTRVWRVDDTGTVGDTEIQFDLTGLGYGSNADDFRLIISNTATMADGSLTAGGTFNGSVLSFSGIDLTDGQYFTLATALETCGPGGVNTNIALWLRADLQVFSDAGTTAAVDAIDVQQWNDQSSPTDNGSQSDAGGGTPVDPTFETNEINFNPVLRFIDPNSTNSSYIETSANTVSGDMTLISVFQSGQDQGTSNDFVNTPALIGASETGSTLDYGLGMFEGQVIMNANTTVVFDASTASTYNDSRPHIALATRDQSSGAVEIFMEGITDGTGTGSTSALTGSTSFGIGNHSDADVQAQYGGDIAETIVFSTVLTGEEQSRVESYLALKYGLTLSANRDGDGNTNELISGAINEGDYVAGDGGVVWDYADQGATYYNDIFGIARDDVSCFEQTQSQSESADAMVTFNNASGFSANDSWLISGNDNAPIEAEDNKERPAGIHSRLNREWRVQETGTVGQIELTYDLSSVTGTPLGDNNLNLVRLMVDNDGDFTSGVTLIEPTSIDGGAQTVTFLVDFTDGQYYTLGSTEIEALPITLISFDTRTTSDNKVEVFWATAQEINNSFFTIERSRDAVTFETVGFVEGSGNSDIIVDYRFVDKEPLDGVSYYRLKQTDFNGDFDYSEISRVFLDLPQSSVHQVVPNPVNRGENFRITYPVQTEKEVQISIANANGIVTLNETVSIRPEDGEIQISTQGLNRGLYFIKILDKHNYQITLKFIVK